MDQEDNGIIHYAIFLKDTNIRSPLGNKIVLTHFLSNNEQTTELFSSNTIALLHCMSTVNLLLFKHSNWELQFLSDHL